MQRKNTVSCWLLASIVGAVGQPAFAQVQLQPEARLGAVASNGPLTDLPTTINTLDLVAKSDLKNGVSIAVWRYSTKYGEGDCDRGAGTAGAGAKSCPRVGLLVSTRWELEDNSKFALWSVSDRQWWRVAGAVDSRTPGKFDDQGTTSDLVLYACEASRNVATGSVQPSLSDNWHAVPYRLRVGAYDQVSLVRLPEQGPQRNCFGDDAAPRPPPKT
ncbi:hypothetical protein [Xanthomonas graminis]|uniref:Secreted protein n=1 Tax=Xanthomonas graminis pv. poae TaxID=227946 RepID=A0A199P4B4_9XANT|nr:hypothetical protein [Xanthomonas translucens]OAX55728.1 hypothetical protein A6R73_16295 [Xanthomonas translucens pv. poae]